MSARAVGQLARGALIALARQQLLWMMKKVIKTTAAPLCDRARDLILSK
jgi:hypothetical protein